MPRSCRYGWVDVAVLLVACAIMYLPALDAVGLSTWQESQRAMVSREMHQAGHWVVPLINGQPYLAKPPLYYWCNLMLARVPGVGGEGGAPDEHTLRLTSALFATLGVLATYLVARGLCAEGLTRRSLWSVPPEVHTRGAGLLAGLMLASGPAYARAARVGELDIALAPSVCLAIGALGLAWMSWQRRGRLAWGWLMLSAIAGAAAALTKGPPALALIGGACALTLLMAAARERSRAHAHAVFDPASEPRAPVIVGAGCALGTLPFTVGDGLSVPHLVGVVANALAIGWLGATAARALTQGRAGALARSVWSVQPWFTIGLPVLALAAWAWAAAARVGLDAAARWSEGEAESNFVLLDAEVPFINLASAAWSVGLASLLGIVGVWWVVARRPRLTPGGLVVAGWLLGGFVIFSCFGKGFQRYLIPLWPAVAVVGGEVAMRLIADSTRRAARAALMGGVLAALVIGLGVWFAVVHPRANAQRSPRELLAELRGDPHINGHAGAEQRPALAVFQFWTAAIDYYAGERPIIIGDVLEKDQNVGSTPLKEREFAERLRRDGQTYLVLMRETERPDRLARGTNVPGPERLRRLGLEVQIVPTSSAFWFDGGRTRIVAGLVRAGADPAERAEPEPADAGGAAEVTGDRPPSPREP